MPNEKTLKVTLLESTPNARKIVFSAVRTCYSPNAPTDIFRTEYDKYNTRPPADGGLGTDVDRLLRHIVDSKHTSTLEHVSFTFGIEGVSRSLLAQLTRHRVGIAYSVQSQRYVTDKSDGKKGGFGYVVPPKITANRSAEWLYNNTMEVLQDVYDALTALGIYKCYNKSDP